jgi:hypothetical protein
MILMMVGDRFEVGKWLCQNGSGMTLAIALSHLGNPVCGSILTLSI